ncbi:hypothetical protein BDZ94DRAFT_1299519 [Collybia nuda]|uniref:F-box domain-containing protein n=1 Tax=Collybia nuda TaxID=64659 RepID=A0A9P6CHL0_9AGAR|nr:hypothetical protein BDZ94DRAFT_1299519 [Collybia nuda]
MNAHEQADTHRTLEIEDRAVSSNEVLSDAEQSMIRKLLIETEYYIKSLDDNILQLPTAIADLQTPRAEALCRIKRLQTGIAPHRKVPHEILLNIFIGVLDGPTIYLPPRREQSIWNLMQVCSRWRQIIMAEPMIWGRISMINIKYSESLNALTHNIFSNCGRGCLITYQTSSIVSEEVWKGLFSLISTHPTRFRHIEFMFREFSPPSVDNTPPIVLNHLESIGLVFRSNLIYDRDTPAMNFLKSEGLQDVSIYTLYPCQDSAWLGRIILPWIQLKKLAIQSITVSVLLSILQNTAILEDCTVMVQFDPTLVFGALLEGPNIRLEHLRTLILTAPPHREITKNLIDALTVPKLEYLAFEGNCWDVWPQDSVLRLIARSGCLFKVPNSGTDSLEGLWVEL